MNGPVLELREVGTTVNEATILPYCGDNQTRLHFECDENGVLPSDQDWESQAVTIDCGGIAVMVPKNVVHACRLMASIVIATKKKETAESWHRLGNSNILPVEAPKISESDFQKLWRKRLGEKGD